MKTRFVLLLFIFAFAGIAYADGLKVSKQTQSCLNCHNGFTPGIVKDWEKSLHSKTRPEDAIKKPLIERRISISKLPEELEDYVVGCYECHGLNTEDHKDAFDHFGHRINVVVSPKDCAVCHPKETDEYSNSKKAHAIGNLDKNPVYTLLVDSIIGLKTFDGSKLSTEKPTNHTKADACFGCHGMPLRVKGMKKLPTPLGVIDVPDIENWPSQGVGRLNPDGSMGACTSCHPRHSFSIETARDPRTCSQCHLEPDTPAWNVYAESKHGNIFLSKSYKSKMDSVPWKLGEDFTVPTCAVCHSSLIVDPNGKVIAERTHDFGSRLWVRIFGLPYTHPQPRHGDTSTINNKDGQPIPTTFNGEPAIEGLIDRKEQDVRLAKMKALCKGCHSTDWIDKHFERFDNTVKETDKMTLTATKLMMKGWEVGVANARNPFDESMEKMWIKQWLFYANSTRYASAMTGAYDYAAFHYGWWDMTLNLNEMKHMIEIEERLKEGHK